MSLNLTGILPTYGRYSLLLERIEAISAYPFPVLVLDSCLEPIPDLVDKIQAVPNIEYHHFPGTHTNTRYMRILPDIKTAYVLPLADDDIVCPGTVCECVSFLEKHPDYVACQGIFWVKNPYTIGGEYLLESHFPSLEQDDPARRLLHHGRHYAHTFYSVQRTEAFRTCVKNTEALLGLMAFCELARSFTLVGLGKVRCLDAVMGLRSPTLEEELSAKPTSVPRLWHEFDPEGYRNARERFLSTQADLPPFSSLGCSTLDAAFAAYWEGVRDPRKTLVQRHKYMLYVLDRLLGKGSGLDALQKLDDQTHEQLYALEQGLMQEITTKPGWKPV